MKDDDVTWEYLEEEIAKIQERLESRQRFADKLEKIMAKKNSATTNESHSES